MPNTPEIPSKFNKLSQEAKPKKFLESDTFSQLKSFIISNETLCKDQDVLENLETLEKYIKASKSFFGKKIKDDVAVKAVNKLIVLANAEIESLIDTSRSNALRDLLDPKHEEKINAAKEVNPDAQVLSEFREFAKKYEKDGTLGQAPYQFAMTANLSQYRDYFSVKEGMEGHIVKDKVLTKLSNTLESILEPQKNLSANFQEPSVTSKQNEQVLEPRAHNFSRSDSIVKLQRRETVYSPMPESSDWVNGKSWTSRTSSDMKKFDDLLTKFKENPSSQSLKPLENYLGDSLNKSKVQNTIRSLPEAKCPPEAKQALQKQVGEAIVKMATQQSR